MTLTPINLTTILELVLSGLITFIFGVATGVTTHFLRRELDRRVAGWERQIPARRRLSRPRRINLLERFQRVMVPIIPLLPILVIVVLVGSFWMFLGYFTTMGVIVGLRWDNQ